MIIEFENLAEKGALDCGSDSLRPQPLRFWNGIVSRSFIGILLLFDGGPPIHSARWNRKLRFCWMPKRCPFHYETDWGGARSMIIACENLPAPLADLTVSHGVLEYCLGSLGPHRLQNSIFLMTIWKCRALSVPRKCIFICHYFTMVKRIFVFVWIASTCESNLFWA